MDGKRAFCELRRVTCCPTPSSNGRRVHLLHRKTRPTKKPSAPTLRTCGATQAIPPHPYSTGRQSRICLRDRCEQAAHYLIARGLSVRARSVRGSKTTKWCWTFKDWRTLAGRVTMRGKSGNLVLTLRFAHRGPSAAEKMSGRSHSHQ